MGWASDTLAPTESGAHPAMPMATSSSARPGRIVGRTPPVASSGRISTSRTNRSSPPWVGMDPMMNGTPASVDPATGQPAVFFPGDQGYDRNAPKVIVDAWGTPIRYYRVTYPTGTPGGSYPANYQPFPLGSSGDGQDPLSDWRYRPRLSEFIALRPWEIDGEQATDYFFAPGGSSPSWGDFNDLGSGVMGDSTTTASLESGEFAFLSGGPDRRIFNWHSHRLPRPGRQWTAAPSRTGSAIVHPGARTPPGTPTVEGRIADRSPGTKGLRPKRPTETTSGRSGNEVLDIPPRLHAHRTHGHDRGDPDPRDHCAVRGQPRPAQERG